MILDVAFPCFWCGGLRALQARGALAAIVVG